MDVKVTIKGVGETINKIQAFNDIAYSEIGKTMFNLVNDFVTDARNFAPVDTGYLRDHITGRVISKIRGIIIVGRVRSSARYSIYQEFGVPGRNKAQPFMMTAWHKNKFRIREELRSAMETAILKASVGAHYGGGVGGILEKDIL